MPTNQQNTCLYLNNLICWIFFFFKIFREESYDVLAVADWGQRLSFYQLSGKQVNAVIYVYVVHIFSNCSFKLESVKRNCMQLYICAVIKSITKSYFGCICMKYVTCI